MAIVSIPDLNKEITDSGEISAYLKPLGIYYEVWETKSQISDKSSDEEILEAYAAEIEKLKVQGDYVTADIINVNPETPGLDAMLDKFKVEHTHDEDEVRFVIAGSGIFHINPVSQEVFSIEMHAGDLINVPRGTRHWFNLCKEKSIKTIRLFQDPGGWTPHYVKDSAHVKYEPVCFGNSYIASKSSLKGEA